MEAILRHLGLSPKATAEGFSVSAPSFRFDIEIEADVIEEIGRVYGYDNTPDERTSGRLKMLPLPETKRSRFDVYRQMAARGYQEVVSYAFVNEEWERDLQPMPIRFVCRKPAGGAICGDAFLLNRRLGGYFAKQPQPQTKPRARV